MHKATRVDAHILNILRDTVDYTNSSDSIEQEGEHEHSHIGYTPTHPPLHTIFTHT